MTPEGRGRGPGEVGGKRPVCCREGPQTQEPGSNSSRHARQLEPVITHPKRREKRRKKGKLAEGVEVGGGGGQTPAQSLTVLFQTKDLAGGENPERAG